tara:strand:- start:3582 stop:4832 length:1251 start_codon:yes stop_codon:yes gene_type:complete
MIKLLKKIGINSQKAFKNKINVKVKNKVLEKYASLIEKNKIKIIYENKKDIKFAKKNGLRENLIKRLVLNDKKINEIIKSIKKIINLKDPVDVILDKWNRPNGLKIKRVTVPLGIIGIIYESRPNVTSDVSSLCFKSGNCVILKGGSEAYFSNKILVNLFRQSLKTNKIDKNFVQFIESRDRKIVDLLLSKMNNYINIMIPRGGKNLVKKVQKFSNIPVIGHLEGICHTYVDKDADFKSANKIVHNAKLRNTSICGATETILIHKQYPKKFTNLILKQLEDNNCIIYADHGIKKIFKGKSLKANKKSWSTEYLSEKVSVKFVKNVFDAVNHINKFGTKHTDSIITKNKKTAEYFIKNVKSCIAMLNTSTQFADGSEFGFGGEVGISTNNLPPRGPVGLNQLVTYKYEVFSKGQIRK